MKNNTAFAATLKNIRPIAGADKIVQADVTLNDVVITSIVTGVDTKENLPVIYFDSNMCLSDQLIKDMPDLARYLAKGNRVRVVKLRGCVSNGLAVRVEEFARYTQDKLEEGFSFTELNGIEICYKYTAPIRSQSHSKGSKKEKKGKKQSRMIPEQFAFHVDTDQLVRNAHKIHPDDVISCSSKWHGTSSICGNVLVKKNLSLTERIARLFKVEVIDSVYDYVYASRTVVKNGLMEKGLSGYYGEDLWTACGEEYFKGKLHKGETVYYEIVGYLPSGGWIQKGFDYGCKPNEHKIVVYRITKTGIDGDVVEYAWQAMKERCKEINVEHVKELYFGKAKDLFPELDVTEHWNQNFVQKLKEKYLEKDLDCNISCKVPDEGIVLRVEAKGIEVYKLKSERFYLKESELHEKGEADVEEEQG